MPRDLVLVHGGLHNASCWGRVVAALGELEPRPFGRALQLDWPGSGSKRARNTEAVRRDDVVQELTAEVAGAGLDEPILVGHSVAGALLPEMAQAHRYAGVCFLAAPVLSPGQAPADVLGTGVRGADPDRVGYPLDPATTSRRELYRAMFCLDMSAEDAEAFLDDCMNDVIPRLVMTEPGRPFDPASLPRPAFIVTLRNPVFPVEWQNRFATRLGGSVRRVEIDTGHDPFFTHPGLLAGVLSELYRD